VNDRVAIVTGGGSGIGKGIAEAFARHGDRVVLLGRDEERLRRAAEDIGGSVEWRRLDVRDREQVATVVAELVERFGTLDVLVNNAAATVEGGAVTTELELAEAESRWDVQLETGLKGAFLMAMAVAPHLRRPGGRIINISSIAAFTGGSRPGSIAYAAAKAGLVGLTMALARELSPQGITANAVAPGLIAGTGLTEGWPQERVQGIVAQTPAGRAGTPEDVAAACLYLASEEGSFVTGQVIHVNGGWLFRA
jgi:3-oxoacyl-[acyl-carrier protein] reductase